MSPGSSWTWVSCEKKIAVIRNGYFFYLIEGNLLSSEHSYIF